MLRIITVNIELRSNFGVYEPLLIQVSMRHYRSGTVNSKSFVGKDLLQIKWNFELTMHFKHEMIGKHFIETSNKVELRINRVRINSVRPVLLLKTRNDE